MKFMYSLMVIVVLFTNCEQATTASSTTEKTDTSATSTTASAAETNTATPDYIFEAIPNSDEQMAVLKGDAGFIIETGPMINGVRTGTWTYNHAQTPYPAKIISYVNGKINGIYLEINDRGQIEQMAHYKDNKLHGAWAKMRFGKPEMSADYTEGEIDGVYKEFDFRNGKIKKEVAFKNGKEDGLMKFYNEEGEVTVEYVYRNGEKISGGIVDK